MHSIVNLKTSGIALICISVAVTLAAVHHFTSYHNQPIDLSFFILLIILFLPHYAFWNRLTSSSFLRGLVVSFIMLSTLITFYLYWDSIFLSHAAEGVMVFALVPGLQLLLYFFLWVIGLIIRATGGK